MIKHIAQNLGDMPRATLATLMLAVFTVSVGFGIALPLLPDLIERLLGAGVTAAQVSRHTGLLTAVYTSLFLFAPMWGRLSDRRGARRVLLVGLLGFGATLLIFSFIESLAEVYAQRFLSGPFAAAVTPAAMIGNFTTTEQGRARRLAFVTMARIADFLLGPMLGVFISYQRVTRASVETSRRDVSTAIDLTGHFQNRSAPVRPSLQGLHPFVLE